MQEGYERLLRRAFHDKTGKFEDVSEKVIDAALGTLTYQHTYVLRRRCGIGCEPTTLRAIGVEFERSEKTIRGIEARALRNLRASFRKKGIFYKTPVPEVEVAAEPAPPEKNPILKERIADRYELLTARTVNALTRANILFIGDLVQQKEWELLKRPNFGRKSLKEVKEDLAEDGLTLGTRLDNWSPVD